MEAGKNTSEMANVAAVFYNRLKSDEFKTLGSSQPAITAQTTAMTTEDTTHITLRDYHRDLFALPVLTLLKPLSTPQKIALITIL